MLPSTVVRLANDFANVVAIKKGDMVQAMQLLKQNPKIF
jgi:4-hydroxy-tetrahydrodipicolinate synthase